MIATATADVFNLGATILGLAGLAGLAWAVFRVKGTGATIDLLEQSVRIERAERQALDVRCKLQVADLDARISVLTKEFAETISKQVVLEVTHYLDSRP